MRVLGVHCGHNSSACLLDDGVLKWAVQEERFTNEKNQGGFPAESIQFILDSARERIDKVAVASRNSPAPDTRENRRENWKSRNGVEYRLKQKLRETPLYTLNSKKQQLERTRQLREFGFSPSQVEFVEHHRCHAAAAYFGSEWRDDVLVLTNDGRGEKLCGTVNLGDGGSIERVAEIPEGNSVGSLYALTTLELGFIPHEHEYKLMGMAPYVHDEQWRNEVKNVFSDYLSVDGNEIRRDIPEPMYMALSRLKDDLEDYRFDWVSAGLQRFTEELLLEWIENCIRDTGRRKLCLAGGTFMNVKVNKLVAEHDLVDDVFIFPSCGDESNSIGAAYSVASGNGDTIEPLDDVFLGPAIDETDVEAKLETTDHEYEYHENIEEKVADLLADGNIVARCNGRLEFGARALGNRSILADPRDQDAVRVINDMIKDRDFWMPFAPSILAESADDYIDYDGDLTAPYMIKAFDTTENWDEMIAAIHPADQSTRPQIVEPEHNPDYHRLLQSFEEQTGRGVVLNTSFNLHGSPIVRSPKDALYVFEKSGLQHLALGNYLISK